MIVVVCNVGSTSLKFKVYEMPAEAELATGKIDRIGPAGGSTVSYRSPQVILDREIGTVNYGSAVRIMIECISGDASDTSSPQMIDAVGFKTVHARGINDTCLLDDDIIERMEEYSSVAPSHNPPYLRAIRLVREFLPTTPLIGVFEAHFHKTIPDRLAAYALPFEFFAEGLRKYGFHGSSHHYISLRIAELEGNRARRVISCHLGGSSSLCAILDGKSLDTSMGFSPQSGLPQGTRCGDIDPYVMVHLQKDKGYTLDQVEDLLGRKSGLLGLSGVSAEMSDVIAAAERGDTRAEHAISVYCDAAKKYIGSYAALLGGVDAMVFTGGIGENSPLVRQRMLAGLEFLGVTLDAQANLAGPKERLISNGPCRVYVIPANEELIVARETARVLLEVG